MYLYLKLIQIEEKFKEVKVALKKRPRQNLIYSILKNLQHGKEIAVLKIVNYSHT